MNWGNLLLANAIRDFTDKVIAGLSDVVYSVHTFFGKYVFYSIWRFLAWLVSGIETIFRKLAGLGTDTTDMATEIINNQQVSNIFANLVSLATALIIFFTIIKIIQEHYKEKDGGNPYKIVLRTFKGLLMFFFVQGAVIVGLYASGIMFRALDAATGGGTTSITGQVFKAMASDANRLNIGRTNDGMESYAMNQYYDRLVDGADYTNGRYVIVENTSNPNTASMTAQKYLDLFPSMAYGVVGSNGEIVSTLSSYLQTADDSSGNDWSSSWSEIETEWNNLWYSENTKNLNYINNNNWESEGKISGSVGYSSDILQGITTTITPSINLTWSPIDIVNYGYVLKEVNTIQHDAQILVMGTGANVPMSTTFVRYSEPIITEKSLEDSAKQFGITVGGKVALQDGTVTASFDLDMFDTSRFAEILQSVVLNAVYTNLAKMIIQVVPAVPGSTSIYGVNIGYLIVFAPLIMNVVKTVSNRVMADLIPLDPETGEKAVEDFAIASQSTDHNGNIWLYANDKSQYLPITLEQYKFDMNFTDLWSQLVDNYEDFIRQLENAQQDVWNDAQAESELLSQMSGNVQDQQGWQAYANVVDRYNSNAITWLTEMGNLFYLRDRCYSDIPEQYRGSWLYDLGYTENSLDEEIKQLYVNLVSNQPISSSKPSNLYADARLTASVYQPIIKLNTTVARAQSMTVEQIRNSMLNNQSDNGKVVVNMLIDCNGKYTDDSGQNITGAYRLIDWNAYGEAYAHNTNFSSNNKVNPSLYADFYCSTDDLNSNEYRGEAGRRASSAAALRLCDCDLSTTNTGLNYFLNQTTVSSNPFIAASNSTLKLAANSFWGSKGVYIDGTRFFQAYQGTSACYDKDNTVENTSLNTSSLGTSSVAESVSSGVLVRTSSAQYNSSMNQGMESCSAGLMTMSNPDTTTEYAKEFSKHIITLRRLDAQGDSSGDKKVLDGWVQSQKEVKLNDGSWVVNPICRINASSAGSRADQINMIMASTTHRRYLMLTKSGDDSLEHYSDCLGVMNYTNIKAVNALYDVTEMNWIVGFIAIITATGVYLNFVFGLIQRAVNMAVLYVMSPIAISFYPFDDGQKFNQQFVTPFYKEAISAYAIIVSLNLFIVFISPVQDAVEAVAGTAMGWIGLVAFVSMLPKIRDMITSLLGAGSIGEKGLKDTFKSARGSLAKSGLTVAGMVGGAALLRTGIDRSKALKNANNAKTIEKLQAKKSKGELGWWGEQRLNRMSESAAQDSQRKIDNARATGDKSGLTKSEVRRLDRQERAAATRASQLVDKSKYDTTTSEGLSAYNNAVKNKKNELLADENFKKSVNGVVAATRVGQDGKRIASGAKRGAGKIVNGTVSFANKVGIVSAAKGIRDSAVGQMIATKYGTSSEVLQDKKSVIGEIYRWSNVGGVRSKAQNDFGKKRRALESEKKSHREAMWAGLNLESSNRIKGDEAIMNRAKHNVAMEVLSGKSVNEKLADLLRADYVSKGDSAYDARKKANEQLSQITDRKQILHMYQELGGDERYANGISKGLKEFTDANLKIDFNQDDNKAKLNEAEKALRTKMLEGKSNIKLEFDKGLKFEETSIQQFAESMAAKLGLQDKKSIDKITTTLKNTDENTSLDDLSKKMATDLGQDAVSVHKAMATSGYSKDFTNKKNEFDDLRAIMEAQKAYDKGTESFMTKIGYVPGNDKEEILRVFRNVNDASLNSTNENSLGYQMNDIINGYADGLKDPECQQKVDALKTKMKSELDVALASFERKYAGSIREHDISQKHNQEMQAVDAMSMVGEIQKQREFHFNMNMDRESTNAILKDTFIQDQHAKGRYADVGLLMQQLVDLVNQHDYEGAKNLGFNEKTVNAVIQWEKDGETRRLDGFRGLGVFDAAHLGSVSTNMGGSSMAGMESVLMNYIRIAEQNAIISKYKGTDQAESSKESQARDAITNIINQIPNTFGGEEWKDVYKNIKDMKGNVVTNADTFAEALKKSLESANNGDVNEIVKANMKALRDFRSKDENKDNITVNNAVSTILNGFAYADTANQAAENALNIREMIRKAEEGIIDAMNKTKDFQG